MADPEYIKGRGRTLCVRAQKNWPHPQIVLNHTPDRSWTDHWMCSEIESWHCFVRQVWFSVINYIHFLLASPSTLSTSPYPGSISVYFAYKGSEKGDGHMPLVPPAWICQWFSIALYLYTWVWSVSYWHFHASEVKAYSFLLIFHCLKSPCLRYLHKLFLWLLWLQASHSVYNMHYKYASVCHFMS